MSALSGRLGAAALVLLMAGCDLLKTTDAESIGGRGPTQFDPYASSRSGAIRLALRMFNGCAVLASGTPVARGSMDIPYPAECPMMAFPDPNDATMEPWGVLTMNSGENYFLNQLTIVDTLVDAHTQYATPAEALEWMAHESVFKSLDWSGASISFENWVPSFGPLWNREVHFGNAAWMKQADSSFHIEVLDSGGQVRADVTYDKKDFLATSPISGHSRFVWRVENVLPPRFAGDVEPQIDEEFGPPTFRTMARMELFGSTNPFKSFRMPDITGEGAIRVTWSLMPEQPFYFPVTFVKDDGVEATCYGGDAGTDLVPCGFGLDPTFEIAPPPNGKGYYEPGETVDMRVSLRDADGNRLHERDSLPSYGDFLSDSPAASGVILYTEYQDLIFGDKDQTAAFAVVGPLHALGGLSDPNDRSFFRFPEGGFEQTLFESASAEELVPTFLDARWTTRYGVQLPEDAKPGTYVALIKAHREYLGERTSKMTAVPFQVGTTERTTYPGRVGNCQICHRGVLSLDNLRHGLSADHVESCSACHALDRQLWKREVHQIHALSPNYKAELRDCTVCHITQESATKPSMSVCSSCHPSVHGGEYFEMQYATEGLANRNSNCAQTCHQGTLPANHILPAR